MQDLRWSRRLTARNAQGGMDAEAQRYLGKSRFE